MIYLYIGDPADPEVDPEVDDPRATNNMLYKTTDLKHQYSNRRPVDNQQRERPRDPSAATHYPPLDTVQPCP